MAIHGFCKVEVNENIISELKERLIKNADEFIAEVSKQLNQYVISFQSLPTSNITFMSSFEVDYIFSFIAIDLLESKIFCTIELK